MAPSEPSVEWREKYPSLTATPSPPGMPQDIFSIHGLPSPCVCSHPLWTVRQAQTRNRFFPVHLGWERIALPAPCAAAYVWLSEETQSARGAPGWEGSQPLAAKGCGSPRISAWPAGMGSVSSALARSRNAAVVQPGSSPPPPPEVPLAAPESRKDSRTQRLGLGCQGSSRPPAAWELQAASPSPEALQKLEGAELSPVLKCWPTMSQSSGSSAGEFRG